MKATIKQNPNILTKLYNILFRETLVPLLLMLITPHLTLMLSYIVVAKNSNLNQILSNNFLTTLRDAWLSVQWFDKECWALIIGILIWGAVSLYLPGKPYNGPRTTNGYLPKYWHTGFRFYIITMLFAIPLIAKVSVLHLYFKIPSFAGILIAFGYAFCISLYIKGLLFPSPGIFNRTNNPIFDFYWGVELYPHLGRVISLKLLIICRFGLILWQLIVLIAWKANYEILPNNITINYALTATTILQSIYLAKFYYWEDGYMNTIDTAFDRFGYYVAWGCIAFVPGFYPLTSIYLVKNSSYNQFGIISFILTISAGILVIALNYWSDQQKLEFRANDGKCNIWGRPAKMIRAKYVDDFGKMKSSILLTSGFWGITRHMNYTFELISTLLWSLPALLTSPIPYLYFIFLTLLLIHRSVRDDTKCENKYNIYWKQYKDAVKYHMIPYIF